MKAKLVGTKRELSKMNRRDVDSLMPAYYQYSRYSDYSRYSQYKIYTEHNQWGS